MDPQSLGIGFLLLIILAAFVYSSVGHGGASGYLAVMAMFHVSHDVMRPSALIMNAVVSLVSFLLFHRKVAIRWPLFVALAIGSIPASFLGASIWVQSSVYHKILGLLLIVSTVRLFVRKIEIAHTHDNPPLGVAIGIGVAIGTLSGLIGIGGGILLSPLLIYLRWTDVRESAVIASLFIFVNSVSGIIALSVKGFVPDSSLLVWTACALSGAIAGSIVGSTLLANVTLQRVLGLVIVVAACKLLFG